MAYQPLARKYRPATFNDLVGQKSVATALTNAIKLGREPHAVIFAGVRGIGKTTTARLFAKALNCDNGQNPDPCGVCESCRAIEFGNHEDVLEIDGASNTGVDDVRSLKESVAYVPQRSRFKIYIIDEVHMLSQSAFNALLKTLEEPPKHVVFIFATTELQKIPETIMSRCQIFHLQKFSVAELASRIKHILVAESIVFDEPAVEWVARQGKGSMRDALTMLDQIIAFGGGAVSSANIESIAGGVSSEHYIQLLTALINRDATSIFALSEAFQSSSLSMIEHVEELAQFCRHAFVIRDLSVDALDVQQLGLDKNHLSLIKALADLAKPLDLNRLFRTLLKCRLDLDGSSLDQYIFENYAFEWCLDPGLPKLEDIRAYFEQGRGGAQSAPMHTSTVLAQQPAVRTERRAPNLRKGLMDEIQARASEADQSKVVSSLVSETTPKPTEAEIPKVVFPETWRAMVDAWKQSKPLQARILEEAYVQTYSREEIILAVNENSLAAAKLLQPQIQIKVTEAFRDMFGFKGAFKVVKRSGATVASVESTQELTPPADVAPSQNLLEIKAQEKESERERIIDDAKKNPTTQVVLETFNAKIDKIILDT